MGSLHYGCSAFEVIILHNEMRYIKLRFTLLTLLYLLHSIIGYWHHDVVYLSVRPSVTLCIVAFSVYVEG